MTQAPLSSAGSSAKLPARIVNAEGYKQRLIEVFQQRSITYDENNTLHPPLCAELLRLADLRKGDTILDVATGTGLIALAAAQTVGPTGKAG